MRPVCPFLPGLSYSARIDSNTIVLVVHGGAVNNHVATRADIKAISVVATCTVTGLVVNGHLVDSQSITAIDANGLHGSVLNVQVIDRGRAGQTVSGKELGLCLATVSTLAIPPAGTIRVELRAAGTGDGDILALDLQHGARPLLIAPSGCTLEDDLKPKTMSLC